MPLLMIDPPPGSLPPDLDVDVPVGQAAIVPVRQGQLLAIEAPEGGQAAAIFAWATGDAAEWLSPHHTRVFGGTFKLRMGTRLVTNRRRPMFVVGRDSLRRHDLLLPAPASTVRAVADALQQAPLNPPRIADPVNLFASVDLGADGKITVGPSTARAGERWTVRVLIDATVAIAATWPEVASLSGMAAERSGARLRALVRNHVRELPIDLPTLLDEDVSLDSAPTS
jgi:uncharacterized protein